MISNRKFWGYAFIGLSMVILGTWAACDLPPTPDRDIGRYTFHSGNGLAFDTVTGELYRLESIADTGLVYWVPFGFEVGEEVIVSPPVEE
jgi:hypothetical protein